MKELAEQRRESEEERRRREMAETPVSQEAPPLEEERATGIPSEFVGRTLEPGEEKEKKLASQTGRK